MWAQKPMEFAIPPCAVSSSAARLFADYTCSGRFKVLSRSLVSKQRLILPPPAPSTGNDATHVRLRARGRGHGPDASGRWSRHQQSGTALSGRHRSHSVASIHVFVSIKPPFFLFVCFKAVLFLLSARALSSSSCRLHVKAH